MKQSAPKATGLKITERIINISFILLFFYSALTRALILFINQTDQEHGLLLFCFSFTFLIFSIIMYKLDNKYLFFILFMLISIFSFCLSSGENDTSTFLFVLTSIYGFKKRIINTFGFVAIFFIYIVELVASSFLFGYTDEQLFLYVFLYIAGVVYVSLVSDVQPFLFDQDPIYTKDEIELIKHLAAGRTQNEIAKKMNLSVSAIKKKLSDLYWKTNSKRAADCVYKAVKKNII